MSDAGFAVEKLALLYARGFVEGIESATRFQEQMSLLSDPKERDRVMHGFHALIQEAKENPVEFGWRSIYSKETDTHDSDDETKNSWN